MKKFPRKIIIQCVVGERGDMTIFTAEALAKTKEDYIHTLSKIRKKKLQKTVDLGDGDTMKTYIDKDWDVFIVLDKHINELN